MRTAHVGLILGISAALAGIWIYSAHRAPAKVPSKTNPAATVSARPVWAGPEPEATARRLADAREAASVTNSRLITSPNSANVAAKGTTRKSAPSVTTVKEEPKDPLARVALNFVGMDPDANAYWYSAINDPALSAHERQDLIEDLNEDGLSDPEHPSPEDLPLILSRIQLLETVNVDAMDQVNADAFQEAYKDLVNLARTAGGE